jgi:aminocarboxymuconate-semialdehyde decarboxylase
MGLGTVSLQHPHLAADQLGRAVGHWGLAGIEVSTQAGGRDLADRAFDPLWSAAEALDAVVFIHPLGCPPLASRLAPSYLANIAGQPLETTIALSLLIFTGVLDRHPRLRLCAAHGGGYLPHYLGRSERAFAVRPDSATMARSPSHYLRRLWFDSVVHAPDVLARLAAAVGADRIVIGTDYPFDMGDEDPARTLAGTGLPGPARAGIRTANALDLLGAHASRLACAAPVAR